MEMCVDNPREGFADLFSTHPSVDQRVAALVKFAGGHDPGPLALPEPQESIDDEGVAADQDRPTVDEPASAGHPVGPWGGMAQTPAAKPFLPEESPVKLGGSASGDTDTGSEPGPWGPHRRN
jgi:heat shock protein HtpX